MGHQKITYEVSWLSPSKESGLLRVGRGRFRAEWAGTPWGAQAWEVVGDQPGTLPPASRGDPVAPWSQWLHSAPPDGTQTLSYFCC